MKTKHEKMLKRTNKELAEMNNQQKNRVRTFNERFQQFTNVFDDFAKYCYKKWNLALQLFYSDSPLEHPIRLIVDDPKVDPAFVYAALLNHHLAALILKLAINKFVRSPVIIFDSIDYVIDQNFIRYLQKLFIY